MIDDYGKIYEKKTLFTERETCWKITERLVCNQSTMLNKILNYAVQHSLSNDKNHTSLSCFYPKLFVIEDW